MTKENNGETELNPNFVTGYGYGESSFTVRIRRSLSSKFGYTFNPVFSVVAEANVANRKLLEKVKEYFGGVGSISTSGNMLFYEISSLITLPVVIKHFDKYPLQTTKFVYYKLWCIIITMLINKEQLTLEGFMKILAIRAVFGLSEKVLAAYPNVKPINKPEFKHESAPPH
ncbi:MAG TPA: LAGLIDADG family homing endonuclease [Sphingobacteriaceae bacterium]|nr:LAGLIDADG family homing endonuclease [Sphingobacteriaceae bacterium]